MPTKQSITFHTASHLHVTIAHRSDKGVADATLLIGPDSTGEGSSSEVLLAADVTRLVCHCHSAPSLYVFDASNSSSRADFFCQIRVAREPFP